METVQLTDDIAKCNMSVSFTTEVVNENKLRTLVAMRVSSTSLNSNGTITAYDDSAKSVLVDTASNELTENDKQFIDSFKSLVYNFIKNKNY